MAKYIKYIIKKQAKYQSSYGGKEPHPGSPSLPLSLLTGPWALALWNKAQEALVESSSEMRHLDNELMFSVSKDCKAEKQPLPPFPRGSVLWMVQWRSSASLAASGRWPPSCAAAMDLRYAEESANPPASAACAAACLSGTHLWQPLSLGQHTKALKEQHVCKAKQEKRACQTLTSPDRCVSQAHKFI